MRLRTIAAISAVALAAAIAVSVNMSRTPQTTAPTATQSPHGLQAELVDAGYHKTGETKHFSGNAGRDITDQTWERGTAPEKVVLMDNTVAGPGVFVVNAITYYGGDGNGNLACQPNTGVSSPVADLIADADSIRAQIHAGTLKPNGTPGGFPYVGKLVGCLP